MSFEAIRASARLAVVGREMQDAFLRLWIRHGDHIRCEAGNDLALIRALRVLLPAYSGPALTLYCGDGAFNRRRRTHGLAWSRSEKVADSYARSNLWRRCEGGSVLLRVASPPGRPSRCGGDVPRRVLRAELGELVGEPRF